MPNGFRTMGRVTALLGTLIGTSLMGWADQEAPGITILFSQDQARPGDRLEMGVRFTIPRGYHIYGHNVDPETGGYPTKIDFVTPTGLRLGAPVWPTATRKEIPALGASQWYEGEVVVRYPVTMEAAPAGPVRLTALVTYGFCTEHVCQPHDEEMVTGVLRVAAAGASVAPTHPSIFSSRPVSLPSTRPATPSVAALAASQPVDAPAAPTGGDPFRSAVSRGWFLALVLAFGWGLLASLSPCVYPMIPITIAVFAGQSSQSRAKTVWLALCYVMGMVAMYAALGVAAAKAGQDIGAWMANPWVIGGISAIFIAMAFSMFGLFELTLPPGLMTKLAGQSGQGALGALFMGVVLGFVAAPCVGPFAASILAYVATQRDVWLGFWALVSFGFGMGMLFLFLALFAGKIGRLPKSGMWMVTLKEASGFLLLGVTVYFARIFFPASVIGMMGGGLLVWAALHFGAFQSAGHGTSVFTRLWHTALVLLTFIGGFAFLRGLSPVMGWSLETSASAVAEPLVWEHDLEQGWAKARAEQKPVLLDFYADWCIPCHEMDRTVLRDPAVVNALKKFVIIKADCTQPKSFAAQLKTKTMKTLAMPYFAAYGASYLKHLPAGSYAPQSFLEGKTDAVHFLAFLNAVPTTR